MTTLREHIAKVLEQARSEDDSDSKTEAAAGRIKLHSQFGGKVLMELIV